VKPIAARFSGQGGEYGALHAADVRLRQLAAGRGAAAEPVRAELPPFEIGMRREIECVARSHKSFTRKL
jgi:hypothetical protein